jgi:phosphoglycolate phosphatase-like HAD superfamily hydrolase
MKAAAIFDVDGTLVDSVDLHAEAWQRAMQRFGKDVPIEVVRHQIGKGADQLLPDFFSAVELDRIGEPLRDFRGELFRRQYLPRVVAFPGVRELFLSLRARGVRLALASSANGEELEATCASPTSPISWRPRPRRRTSASSTPPAASQSTATRRTSSTRSTPPRS